MKLGQTVNTISHNKLYTNLYNPWYAWSVVSHLRLSERCYNVALACENYNHPVSVAKVIMTIKKGQEELDQFTLTRSEYAKELGITPNAVRMRMRHGKLSGEFRFDGSKYIFRSSKRPGENYETDHPIFTKMTTPKKKIKRGNPVSYTHLTLPTKRIV